MATKPRDRRRSRPAVQDSQAGSPTLDETQKVHQSGKREAERLAILHTRMIAIISSVAANTADLTGDVSIRVGRVEVHLHNKRIEGTTIVQSDGFFNDIVAMEEGAFLCASGLVQQGLELKEAAAVRAFEADDGDAE